MSYKIEITTFVGPLGDHVGVLFPNRSSKRKKRSTGLGDNSLVRVKF